MEHLTKVITLVLNAFTSKNVTFEEYDTCAGNMEYITVGDREIQVNDDFRDEEWCVVLENVKKDGVLITHQELTDILVEVLGPMTATQDRSDIDNKVNNWEIPNDGEGSEVLVVHEGTGLEFRQDYDKV